MGYEMKEPPMTAGRDEVIAEIAEKHSLNLADDWQSHKEDVPPLSRYFEQAIREAISRVGGRERDGWVLVPVEPTEAMLNAANDVSGSQRGSWDDRMAAQYKAMLAATKEG